MLQEISYENINRIKEPTFKSYAEMYLEIYDSFIDQVVQYGLPFNTSRTYVEESKKLLDEIRELPDITMRCEDASIVYKRISPACEACKKGVGTITEHITFKCHRNCFFCFNPNQDNYEAHLDCQNDWRGDLQHIHDGGSILTHIALTGGEPLLHYDECVEFFKTARSLFPEAHLRLYTSGDLLTEPKIKKLAAAGMDEIRFSYKMEDTAKLQTKVLNNMKKAVKHVPCVMVEMPVMPDMEDEMKQLLVTLNDIGVWCINLLELCFPYNNAPAFSERNFTLKYPPYRTLYNFWYAGGLPIAESETVSLRLIKFAAEQGLDLGIHYCSLENKNFGQMYQQNKMSISNHPSMLFSNKDFYLKTVKAFGKDADTVKRLFDRRNITAYRFDARGGFIQFHPSYASHLKGRGVELALSVNVLEERDGQLITRELKLLRADIADCDPELL